MKKKTLNYFLYSLAIKYPTPPNLNYNYIFGMLALICLVITNFVSILPIIGYDVLEWLWGGPTVGNTTLGRFFSLHYIFPFIILGVVIARLYKLHNVGSSNPIGTNFSSDKGFFGPYFLLKDAFTVFLFLICFSITLGYITPEWYFLVFYAIPKVVFLFLCNVLVCFSMNLFTTFMINSLKTLFESAFGKGIELISKNNFLSHLTFYFCAFVTTLRVIVGKESILVPIIPIGLSTFLAGMFLIGLISKYFVVFILMVTATQIINLDIWGHLFATYIIKNKTSLFVINYFKFVNDRIAYYGNKPFKRQMWSHARHVFMGSSGLIPIGRATILAGAMTGSAILIDGELNRRHASDEAMKQRKFEAWKMEYHTWESSSAKYGEPAPKPPIK